jgi:hypothetical protein
MSIVPTNKPCVINISAADEHQIDSTVGLQEIEARITALVFASVLHPERGPAVRSVLDATSFTPINLPHLSNAPDQKRAGSLAMWMNLCTRLLHLVVSPSPMTIAASSQEVAGLCCLQH